MVLVNQHFLLKASVLTSCCSIGLKRNLDTIFLVVFSWAMCLPISKEKSYRFMPFTCNSVGGIFFLSFWDFIPHISCKVTQTKSEVTSFFLILKLLKQQVCFPSINHHAFLFWYCHVATVWWEFFNLLNFTDWNLIFIGDHMVRHSIVISLLSFRINFFWTFTGEKCH